jgi:hypothetical protein
MGTRRDRNNGANGANGRQESMDDNERTTMNQMTTRQSGQGQGWNDSNDGRQGGGRERREPLPCQERG